MPSTFLVFLARFIFSSLLDDESLEELPEELLPEEDDEEPLLDELDLEDLRFLAGALGFFGADFFAAFLFLSSEELVPDEELLLEDFLPPLAAFGPADFFYYFLFLSLLEDPEDDELLDFFCVGA